jgi:hypothetical protein
MVFTLNMRTKNAAHSTTCVQRSPQNGCIGKRNDPGTQHSSFCNTALAGVRQGSKALAILCFMIGSHSAFHPPD